MKTGESGTTFVFGTGLNGTGFDLSAYTKLTLIFTLPNSTTLTETSPTVVLGSATLPIPGGTLSPHQYVSCVLQPGQVSVAGVWQVRLIYDQSTANPPIHFSSATEKFIVAAVALGQVPGPPTPPVVRVPISPVSAASYAGSAGIHIASSTSVSIPLFNASTSGSAGTIVVLAPITVSLIAASAVAAAGTSGVHTSDTSNVSVPLFGTGVSGNVSSPTASALSVALPQANATGSVGISGVHISGSSSLSVPLFGVSTSSNAVVLGVGPSGPQLTTMTLVNTSGSIQVNGFITPIFGMTFKKGDVPINTAPKFQIGGIDQPYSWGLQSYYSDGSLRHASFMFRCSASIAGNGMVTVNILSGGTAPSTSSRTLTEVYAQNLQVGGAGIGSFGGLTGTWTGYLTNDANNTEQYIYMDGQAGTCWRIKTHMAQSAGGTPHGQLEVYHYITALQDVSGNLGGFRHIGRITQPYYNNDTPTKDWRAFSSIAWQHGAGPTAVNLTWPYGTVNFTGSNGSPTYTVASAGTHNFYQGAQAGSGGGFTNCVPGYVSATTDAALSANKIYYAYTINTPSNNTQFNLCDNPCYAPNGLGISSSGGTGTFVPIPICLHFCSIYTGDTQGRVNFFQGTGSMSADGTVRTQFNQAYLHSTGAVPPWNLASNGMTYGGTIKDVAHAVGSPSQAYWQSSPAWTPVSCGPLSPAARGSAGSNLEIGSQTAFHGCHFFNQTATDDLAVRSMAYAMDFDGSASFRDVVSGNYPNFSNSSYTGMAAPTSAQQSTLLFGFGSYAGFTPPANPSSPNSFSAFIWGGEQNNAHKPSMAFYAFLVFGEPHFHDLMLEGANSAYIETNGGWRARTSPQPTGYGILCQNGMRPTAWAYRDLMLAAMFGAQNHPDGSQVCQYYRDMLSGNATFYNQLFSSTYQGTFLASENHWSNLQNQSGDTIPAGDCGSFQLGYWLCIVAWAAALGDSGAMTWLNTYATWINYVINTYGDYYFYCLYDAYTVIGPNGNPTGPITAANIYGIATSMMTSLSWTTSSPCFSVNGPTDGFVPSNGDRWVFGADQETNPGNFSVETPYYAVNVSGNNFDLSASPSGTAITASNSGTIIAGGGAGGGASSPYLIYNNTPAPSTGLAPSAVGNPDSYLMYRLAGANWAQAAGAAGYGTAVSNATTRMNVNLPDFTANTLWYMQNSF